MRCICHLRGSRKLTCVYMWGWCQAAVDAGSRHPPGGPRTVCANGQLRDPQRERPRGTEGAGEPAGSGRGTHRTVIGVRGQALCSCCSPPPGVGSHTHLASRGQWAHCHQLWGATRWRQPVRWYGGTVGRNFSARRLPGQSAARGASPDRIWGRIDTSSAERTTVPPYHLDPRRLSYSELVPACQHPLLFELGHCICHPGGMPVDQQWLTTAHSRA